MNQRVHYLLHPTFLGEYFFFPNLIPSKFIVLLNPSTDQRNVIWRTFVRRLLVTLAFATLQIYLHVATAPDLNIFLTFNHEDVITVPYITA